MAKIMSPEEFFGAKTEMSPEEFFGKNGAATAAPQPEMTWDEQLAADVINNAGISASNTRGAQFGRKLGAVIPQAIEGIVEGGKGLYDAAKEGRLIEAGKNMASAMAKGTGESVGRFLGVMDENGNPIIQYDIQPNNEEFFTGDMGTLRAPVGQIVGQSLKNAEQNPGDWIQGALTVGGVGPGLAGKAMQGKSIGMIDKAANVMMNPLEALRGGASMGKAAVKSMSDNVFSNLPDATKKRIYEQGMRDSISNKVPLEQAMESAKQEYVMRSNAKNNIDANVAEDIEKLGGREARPYTDKELDMMSNPEKYPLSKETQLMSPEEFKPIEPVVAEPQFGTPSLAKGVEIEAIAKKLVDDFGELPTYQKMNMQEQASMAKSIVESDYELAKRMAMGDEPLPEGLRDASIYETVKAEALKFGDVDTLRRLATESKIPSKITEYAQAVKAADIANDLGNRWADPVKAMQDLAETRAKNAGKVGKSDINMDALEADVLRTKNAYDNHVVEKTTGSAKYGSNNTIITMDAYNVAKKELRSKMGQMNAGIDPTVLVPLAKIGAYHLEAGVRSFSTWSKAMTNDLGDWVQPHLRSIWDETNAKYGEEAQKAKALETYKSRKGREVSDIERKLVERDFTKKQRTSAVLDEKAKILKDEYERAKRARDAGAERSGTVTSDEAKQIVNQSKAVAAARERMNAGGNRLEYGLERVNFENMLNDMKGESAPLINTIKNRARQWSREVGEAEGIAQKIKPSINVAKELGKTALDTSVSIVASLDNSFLGRQGLNTLMTHPTVWAKAARKSFEDIAGTLGGKKVRNALWSDIYSRENYLNGRYEKAGIIPKTEEAFPTSLPERIPVVGKLFKASENAFVGSALRMRTGLYDLISNTHAASGIDIASKGYIDSLGKLVNSMTARGKLPQKLEGASKTILWAPKMLAGSFDVLTAHARDVFSMHPAIQMEAAKNLTKIATSTYLALLAANALGADVEFDPRSADFGKIKIGKTRFDITGGKAGLVTLGARLVTGSTKSSTTGKVSELGDGFGKATRASVLEDFLKNKMNPVVGVVRDYMRNRTFAGEKPTIGNAIASTTVPIPVKQAWELKDGASGEAIAGVITDLFGISSNTYKK